MKTITALSLSVGLSLGVSSSVTSLHAGILGDVDNNGKVDVAEAIYALQVAVGSTPDENIPDAVADVTVSKNTLVTLGGSGSSTQDGAPLSYSWSMTNKPSGSAAVLSDSTIENPTFTADLAGSYRVSLTVDDGGNESVVDNVVITARNVPPTANAGVDQTGTIGDQITLDGSGSSDADGDELTYSWVLTPPTGSAAVLSDDAIEQPGFTADVAGSYSAELVVDDGDDVSSADTVLITVSQFGTVTSGGQVWMDRNLGAARVAQAYNDTEAYGDFYQWGRDSDGHERRELDPDTETTSTLSDSDTPGHGKFILTTSNPYDWRSPQNDSLWQAATEINNPCPSGFRLPTDTELNHERLSWSSNDRAGAFASPLKLVVGGYRNLYTGVIHDAGVYGVYWSATVDDNSSSYLYISSSNADMYSNFRGFGFSVRCLED